MFNAYSYNLNQQELGNEGSTISEINMRTSSLHAYSHSYTFIIDVCNKMWIYRVSV